MSDAQKILRMIESCNNQDNRDNTDLLDEIDARFWCLLNGVEYIGTVNNNHMYRGVDWQGLECGQHCGDLVIDDIIVPQYTRSRDALKAIRPEGFNFDIECATTPPVYSYGWQATAWLKDMRMHESPILPTEELAELHAIIQAIEWVENNGK